jgi:6-phosphogluconolactonase (cycloisomerase 2 family)
MDGPGPDPARQDAPHIHQALLGPDPKFLVFADLGADLLRIYSVGDERGVLTSCANFSVTPGSGPRHGDWWVVPGPRKRNARGERSVDVKVGTVGKRAMPDDEFLYIGNELTNNITVYAVSYPADRSCMLLEERQSISTYPGGVGPAGSKLGEVRVRVCLFLLFSFLLLLIYPSNRGLCF